MGRMSLKMDVRTNRFGCGAGRRDMGRSPNSWRWSGVSKLKLEVIVEIVCFKIKYF